MNGPNGGKVSNLIMNGPTLRNLLNMCKKNIKIRKSVHMAPIIKKIEGGLNRLSECIALAKLHILLMKGLQLN